MKDNYKMYSKLIDKTINVKQKKKRNKMMIKCKFAIVWNKLIFNQLQKATILISELGIRLQ